MAGEIVPFAIRHSPFAISRFFAHRADGGDGAALAHRAGVDGGVHQHAAGFRASVTQTDILEGSRAALDLITTDLRSLTPSDGSSNYVSGGTYYPGAVNFCALDNSYAGCSYSGGTLLYQPLQQSLPGSGAQRVNVLNYFFVLGRNNINGHDSWTGTGYVVNATNTSPLYPLYRFYAYTDIAVPPYTLYQVFTNVVNQSQWTNANMSHLLDGVVHLTVRPFDASGYWMTNTCQLMVARPDDERNVAFAFPLSGEVGTYFYSNAVPASVELELGVVEDRALARAASLWHRAGAVQLSRGPVRHTSTFFASA